MVGFSLFSFLIRWDQKLPLICHRLEVGVVPFVLLIETSKPSLVPLFASTFSSVTVVSVDFFSLNPIDTESLFSTVNVFFNFSITYFFPVI